MAVASVLRGASRARDENSGMRKVEMISLPAAPANLRSSAVQPQASFAAVRPELLAMLACLYDCAAKAI